MSCLGPARLVRPSSGSIRGGGRERRPRWRPPRRAQQDEPSARADRADHSTGRTFNTPIPWWRTNELFDSFLRTDERTPGLLFAHRGTNSSELQTDSLRAHAPSHSLPPAKSSGKTPRPARRRCESRRGRCGVVGDHVGGAGGGATPNKKETHPL